MTDFEKELDESIERMAYCIGESKGERLDDTSLIFDEMKKAILSLHQAEITDAIVNELEMLQAAQEAGATHRTSIIQRIAVLKQLKGKS